MDQISKIFKNQHLKGNQAMKSDECIHCLKLVANSTFFYHSIYMQMISIVGQIARHIEGFENEVVKKWKIVVERKGDY